MRNPPGRAHRKHRVLLETLSMMDNGLCSAMQKLLNYLSF